MNRRGISSENAAAPAITLCGPSGSGKTTIAQAYAARYQTFIETVDGNVHIRDLLERKSVFDAYANQSWFLSKVEEFIRSSNPALPIIIDQDPAAIVKGYARMFRDDASISDTDYDSLVKRLMIIERRLAQWRFPRMVIQLDAPADVLRERVLRRDIGRPTPPTEWFEHLRANFNKLCESFPNVARISTETASDDVGQQVAILVERALAAST